MYVHNSTESRLTIYRQHIPCRKRAYVVFLLHCASDPVTVDVVEQVLSRAIDELEPTLTRNGYDAPALATLLKAKPAEIRDFLAGTLQGERTREFTEQLRVAGVPL